MPCGAALPREDPCTNLDALGKPKRRQQVAPLLANSPTRADAELRCVSHIQYRLC